MTTTSIFIITATGNVKQSSTWSIFIAGLDYDDQQNHLMGDTNSHSLKDTLGTMFPEGQATPNGFLFKVKDMGPFLMVQKMLRLLANTFDTIAIAMASNSTVTDGQTSLIQHVWTVTATQKEA